MGLLLLVWPLCSEETSVLVHVLSRVEWQLVFCVRQQDGSQHSYCILKVLKKYLWDLIYNQIVISLNYCSNYWGLYWLNLMFHLPQVRYGLKKKTWFSSVTVCKRLSSRMYLDKTSLLILCCCFAGFQPMSRIQDYSEEIVFKFKFKHFKLDLYLRGLVKFMTFWAEEAKVKGDG